MFCTEESYCCMYIYPMICTEESYCRAQAEAIKQTGATVVTVGIGRYIQKQLTAIAMDTQHSFLFTEFHQMSRRLRQIADSSCGHVPEVKGWCRLKCVFVWFEKFKATLSYLVKLCLDIYDITLECTIIVF